MQTSNSSALPDEKSQAMPGDHLVPNAMAMTTNGITINAPREHVWPWIVQIGAGRAGWYSYDWIDNGGHASTKSILPEHQQLKPGDLVPAIPGTTDAFLAAVVEPPRHLVLTVPGGKGSNQVSYEFLLVPMDQDHTRLIVRGRISHGWPSAPNAGAASSTPRTFIEHVYSVLGRIPRPLTLGVAYVGHRLMESRMLHGIKRRSEEMSRCR